MKDFSALAFAQHLSDREDWDSEVTALCQTILNVWDKYAPDFYDNTDIVNDPSTELMYAMSEDVVYVAFTRTEAYEDYSDMIHMNFPIHYFDLSDDEVEVIEKDKALVQRERNDKIELINLKNRAYDLGYELVKKEQ